MTGRFLGSALVVAVLAGVGALGLSGGDDPYRVSVSLKNGYGLEDGAPVRIGGVDRGTVQLHITKDDTIRADLELDDSVGKVGKNARVAVVAANFLGQKRIDLELGDTTDPAPSGHTLQGGNVATPTDLDQVLGVFDADTRTRAQILISSAGEAVVGRKVDIRKLLAELPAGLQDAAAVVDQLSTDNTTMRALVRRSDNFVSEAVRKRKELSRMIGVLADTAETVNARRVALRQTLAEAPGTLRSLRTFAQELQKTATELSPAARDITAAAPALDATLAKVDTFRQAADPALKTATALAPSLTQLAREATPVVRQAVPTVRSVAELSEALPPVSTAVNRSADNVIAILENWSRAIQFRDGLGHIFRGEASFSLDAVLSAVGRLTPAAKRKRASRPAAKAPAATAPSGSDAPANTPTIKTPKLPRPPLPDIPTLDPALLDYLLKP